MSASVQYFSKIKGSDTWTVSTARTHPLVIEGRQKAKATMLAAGEAGLHGVVAMPVICLKAAFRTVKSNFATLL